MKLLENKIQTFVSYINQSPMDNWNEETDDSSNSEYEYEHDTPLISGKNVSAGYTKLNHIKNNNFAPGGEVLLNVDGYPEVQNYETMRGSGIPSFQNLEAMTIGNYAKLGGSTTTAVSNAAVTTQGFLSTLFWTILTVLQLCIGLSALGMVLYTYILFTSQPSPIITLPPILNQQDVNSIVSAQLMLYNVSTQPNVTNIELRLLGTQEDVTALQSAQTTSENTLVVLTNDVAGLKSQMTVLSQYVFTLPANFTGEIDALKDIIVNGLAQINATQSAIDSQKFYDLWSGIQAIQVLLADTGVILNATTASFILTTMEIRGDVTSVNQTVVSLQGTVSGLQSWQTTTSNTLVSLQNDVASLQSEMQGVKADVSALQQLITQGNINDLVQFGNFTVLQTDVDGLKANVSMMQVTQEATTANLLETNFRLVGTQLNVSALQMADVDLYNSVSGLNLRLANVELNLTHLQGIGVILANNITILDARLVWVETNIVQFVTTDGVLTNNVTQLDLRLKNVESDMVQLQSTNLVLTNSFNQLDSRLTGTQLNVSELQGVDSTLFNSLGGLDSRLTSAENNIITLQNTDLAIATDVNGVRDNVTLLQNTQLTTTATLSGVVNSVATLQSQMGILEQYVFTLPANFTGQIEELDVMITNGLAQINATQSAFDTQRFYELWSSVQLIENLVANTVVTLNATTASFVLTTMQLQGGITQVNQTVLTIQTSVSALEAAQGTTANNLANTQLQVTTNTNDITGIKTNITTALLDVAGVKDNVILLQSDNLITQNMVSILKSNVTDLFSTVASNTERIHTLEMTMVEVQTVLDGARTDILDLTTRVTKLETNATAQAEILTTLQSQPIVDPIALSASILSQANASATQIVNTQISQLVLNNGTSIPEDLSIRSLTLSRDATVRNLTVTSNIRTSNINQDGELLTLGANDPASNLLKLKVYGSIDATENVQATAIVVSGGGTISTAGVVRAGGIQANGIAVNGDISTTGSATVNGDLYVNLGIYTPHINFGSTLLTLGGGNTLNTALIMRAYGEIEAAKLKSNGDITTSSNVVATSGTVFTNNMNYYGGTTLTIGAGVADPIVETITLLDVRGITRIRNNLYVTGGIVTDVSVIANGVTLTSSRKIKINIIPQNLTICMERIMALEVKNYQYNASFAEFSKKPTGVNVTGVIAEQAGEVEPTYMGSRFAQYGWENVTVTDSKTNRTYIERRQLLEEVATVDHTRIEADMLGTLQYVVLDGRELRQDSTQLKIEVATLTATIATMNQTITTLLSRLHALEVAVFGSGS